MLITQAFCPIDFFKKKKSAIYTAVLHRCAIILYIEEIGAPLLAVFFHDKRTYRTKNHPLLKDICELFYYFLFKYIVFSDILYFELLFFITIYCFCNQYKKDPPAFAGGS